MQLAYRGVSYNYEPTAVDLVESNQVCQYRGKRYTINYLRHLPVPQPAHALSYRGVAYQTTEAGTITTLPRVTRPIAQPAFAAQKIDRHLAAEVHRVHQQNIQRRLQQRLEAAKARGDQQLVQQLQHEMELV